MKEGGRESAVQAVSGLRARCLELEELVARLTREIQTAQEDLSSQVSVHGYFSTFCVLPKRRVRFQVWWRLMFAQNVWYHLSIGVQARLSLKVVPYLEGRCNHSSDNSTAKCLSLPLRRPCNFRQYRCGLQTQSKLAATQERNSRALGKLEESLAGESGQRLVLT